MTTIEDTLTDLLGRGIGIADIPGISPNATVLEVSRLSSRKNEVHLLRTHDGNIVLKVFDNERWEREHSTILLCRSIGILVPRPLLLGERYILMEFLEGPNLCDLINDTLNPIYPRMIADWLADFHSAFWDEDGTLVKSDAKLQNFILTESGVAGVDFELAHRGDPIEDLGEVCAHILNTNPMFTGEKYALCDVFLQRYRSLTSRSLEGITDWVVRAMEEAVRFRANQRERLLQEIEELRNEDVWPFCDHDQNR